MKAYHERDDRVDPTRAGYGRTARAGLHLAGASVTRSPVTSKNAETSAQGALGTMTRATAISTSFAGVFFLP